MKRFVLFAVLLAMFASTTLAEQWKPRFALQLYSFRMMTFEEAVNTAKKLGFDYVEAYPGQKLAKDSSFNTNYNACPEARQMMRDILSKADVKMISYGVTGAGNEAQWRELFAFAKDMGIEIVQTEVGKNAETLDIIDKVAGEFGIKVALHNHTQPAGHPDKVKIELEGRKNIGSGADTGHWAVAGTDPLEGVKSLAGKFNSLHLVDEKAIGQGSYIVPFGKGACQIDKILEELKKQNFTGTITLEYERVSPELQKEVGECAQWYKNYFAK